MKIVTAKKGDAERIAAILRGANRDVAKIFGINKENNPKHPSFCTKDWVSADFSRGVEYFLHQNGNIRTGCVAFEQPDPDTAYLNRLAVLPDYRHQGIGSALVGHVITHSRSKNVRIVSIGIIAAHEVLKAWYIDLGFIEKETRQFEHLPFDVTYLHYAL
jgi:ribosomal protein S18 acetylase RimI-like enzyme